MKVCNFIGRFQPFHKGHLSVLTEIIDKFETVIVGIGSAYESRTDRNPFSCGERIDMIRNSIPKKWLNKVLFIPIPDINRSGVYMAHIRDLCPSFEVVVSNNDHTVKLATEAGYEVYKAKTYYPKNANSSDSTERIRGEWIRDYIRDQENHGGYWRVFVPKQVVPYVRKVML